MMDGIEVNFDPACRSPIKRFGTDPLATAALPLAPVVTVAVSPVRHDHKQSLYECCDPFGIVIV